MSRSDFLEELNDRGIAMSAVTLAYWERIGVLPRALRRWQGVPAAFYPMWMLDAVETVCRFKDLFLNIEAIRGRMDALMPTFAAREAHALIVCPCCAGKGYRRTDVAPL